MNIDQLTANKIKETRQKLQLSAEYVAHELQLDKSNYSKLENGRVEINMNRLQELADIFKVPISFLLPFNNNSTYHINCQGDYSFNEHQINNIANTELVELLKKTTDALSKVIDSMK